MIMPPPPTAQPFIVSAKERPKSEVPDTPLVWGDQTVPPPEVCRIKPPNPVPPTVQPFDASTKATPSKTLVAEAPLVWADQRAPPSVVCTIVPPPVPTDQPRTWATTGVTGTRAAASDNTAGSARRPGRCP